MEMPGACHYQKKYDFIISNPPFYENELESPDNKRNIAHHGQGLQLHALLTIIKERLDPNGRFFLLLPYKRNEELRDQLTDHELWIADVVLVRQSVKHGYFRIILSGKHKTDDAGEIEISEIAIRDEKDSYSDEFVSLLKDYYIKL